MPSAPDPPDVRPVIWMRRQVPRRGPRPAHTHEEIARVAVAIADEQGLAQVSIRAIAGELGAGAASLYRYIDAKSDLYDLMVDTVSAEFDLPIVPTGDWRADLLAIAECARVVHGRHPWAFGLSAEASWGPHVQAYMETFLTAVEPAGLSVPEQLELLAHLNSSVATFASFERQQQERPGDPAAQLARLMHLQEIADDPGLPHLSAAVRTVLAAGPADTDPDEQFRRSIRRLIDSVQPRQ